MGRLQTEEEAKQYDDNIKQMLDQFGVSYKEIDGDLMSADIIVQDVQEALSAKNTNLNMYN